MSGCGGAEARRASHIARGEQYLAQDQLEKARIEFAAALQIAPNDAQARFLSGRVAERLGNVRAAAALYQGALDVDPGHVQAHACLARLLVLSGAPARALELIAPVLKSHPDDPELLTARAAARAELKDTGSAITDAERAVQLAPLNEGAVSLLAGLYYQAGQEQRAVELLTATLTHAPNSVDLRQALAKLYVLRGESQRAEEQLQRVVQSKPRDPALRFQLAAFYISEKRLDDAAHTFKAVIAARPESDAAKLAYVDFLTTYRSRAQGERALRDLIANDPHNYSLQLGLGALQQRAGALQDAIGTFRAVIAQDADGPATSRSCGHWRGHTWRTTSRRSQKRTCARRSLRQPETSPRVWIWRSCCGSRGGRTKRSSCSRRRSERCQGKRVPRHEPPWYKPIWPSPTCRPHAWRLRI